jgi:GNAT superfamily N-acetyltransferase
MSVTIRRAVPDDIDGIVSVGRRTWPATYAFAGADYVANGLATWWSREAVQRSLEATTVLVVEDGGAIVGTGNIDLRPEVPTIWKLYVVPEVQGTGTGSALMRELLEVAGGLPVQLEYIDGNARAAHFYAAHGFGEVRRESNVNPGWPDSVWVRRPAVRKF